MVYLHRFTTLALVTLGMALASTRAGAQVNTPEVEPNNSKATATALARPLEPGDTISGGSTPASDDYFILQTAAAPSGIYEHTLTVSSGAAASIIGLSVDSNGVVQPGTTRTIQNSSAIPSAQPRFIRWYGFGRSERVYVTLSATGGATYSATYSRRTIDPLLERLTQPVHVSLGASSGSSFTLAGPRVMDEEFGRVLAAPLPVGARSFNVALADRPTGAVSLDIVDNQPGMPNAAMDFPDVLVAPSQRTGPIDLVLLHDGAQPRTTTYQKTEPFQILWLRLEKDDECVGSWADIGPPGPRRGGAIAYDGTTQRSVFMGGIAPILSGLGTVVWDGARWTHLPIDGPRRLQDLAMAFDPIRARTVLYGGRPGDSLSTSSTWLALVDTWPDQSRVTWLFDGTAWQAITTAVSPGIRSGHCMAFDAARGNVVLSGGANAVSGVTDLATWTWDGFTWRRIDTPGPANRRGAAMAYDPMREQVVLFGGAITSGGTQTAETWLWDGSVWTQSAATGPTARSGHAMVFDASIGRIVLIGGSTFPNDPVWEWDGTAWLRAADPPFQARDLHFAVATYEDARDQILVHGVQDSFNFSGYGTDATWARRAGVWTLVDASPGARLGHAVSVDPGTQAPMLYGGWLADTFQGTPSSLTITLFFSGDTWVRSGNQWHRAEGSSAPGLRTGHSLTHDPLRNRTILFGGRGVATPGGLGVGTWTWDGNTWTLASSAGPSPRVHHAAAFDPVSGGILLFGGSSSTGVTPLGDTWRWDGSTWTRLFVSGPSPRVGAAMIADPERGRVVLFGGASSSSVVLSDTWEWDGISWNQMPSLGATPTARAFHSMAYDASTRTVAMLGGEGDGSLLSGNMNPVPNSETIWDWNGSTWQPRSAHVLPSPASGGAMVFDPQRGTLLWYGGIGGNTGVGSRLFAFQGAAPAITQQPADVAASLDSAATFSIAGQFEGSAFLWRRNGAALADGPGITGSATAELRLDPVTAASEGLYDVVIATPCGTRFSRAAALTVRCRADFDLSGAVNPDDMGDYLNCYFAVPPCPRADFDGDGLVSADDLADFINAFFTACP